MTLLPQLGNETVTFLVHRVSSGDVLIKFHFAVECHCCVRQDTFPRTKTSLLPRHKL